MLATARSGILTSFEKIYMLKRNNEHGGNIFRLAQQHNINIEEIIDLSSNIAENVSGSALRLLEEKLTTIQRLPEPYSESVLSQLSRYYQIPKSFMICGAGTTELIHGLSYCHANRSVLIVQPTYADYEKYALLYGCRIIEQILEENDDFYLNIEKFEELVATVQIVFICNPNNPTGTLIDRQAILSLLQRFPKVIFVLDESYMPFTSFETTQSLLGVEQGNLVVLRSFSKIFAVPGLRMGWLYTPNEELISRLRGFLSPWSLNSLAQIVAEKLIGFEDPSFIDQIQNTKKRLIEQIAPFSWLHPYPSHANFVLIKSHRFSSAMLFDYFGHHKILIRDCSNFTGLDQSFIRLSIKNENNIRKAVDVFRQLHEKSLSW